MSLDLLVTLFLMHPRFLSLFCRATASCWILCYFVSTELSQVFWEHINRKASIWPNSRQWESCHPLQWGHDFTANILTAYTRIMMPHKSQSIVCLTGISAAGSLFANRHRTASPTQVFIKRVSNGPLSLPRAVGIGVKRHTQNVHLVTIFCTF